jgi:hypothetical protein
MANCYRCYARILFAQQLSFRLEYNNLISPMQYGSCPGKQCTSAVLNKQLTFDIVRQSKATIAFIKNNAVVCYDQLINPLLLLQLCHLGAPLSTTTSLSKIGRTPPISLGHNLDCRWSHIGIPLRYLCLDLAKAPL